MNENQDAAGGEQGADQDKRAGIARRDMLRGWG